ncbi:MAG: trypsin-like peptidase domain-containing protein [Planctomycetota bacterium]|jgi:hypothetical protein
MSIFLRGKPLSYRTVLLMAIVLGSIPSTVTVGLAQPRADLSGKEAVTVPSKRGVMRWMSPVPGRLQPRRPKTLAPPCECGGANKSRSLGCHYAEIEVLLDDATTLRRLRSYPRAPGSRLEMLDQGTRVRLQLPALIVADLIEGGADVVVLRDFMLLEMTGDPSGAGRKSLMAPAASCSGSYESGQNDTDYDIPENNWEVSGIVIDGAPSNAVVTCIDVRYVIIHPYVGKLKVDLADDSLTTEYRLWDLEGGATANIDETVTGITDFAGEAANQTWRLWALRATGSAPGYIDYWWIKIYYEIPSGAPNHDACAGAVVVQHGVPYQDSTVGATGGYETWCAYQDLLDVWHVYTPAQTGLVTVSVQSAGFDTTLAVFDQCGGAELACSDDLCDDNSNSEVTMRMVAGTPYYIRVAGYDRDTGTYTLTVDRHPLDFPDQPYQPSPANGAAGVDTRPVLSWNGSAALAQLAKRAKRLPKPDLIEGDSQKVIYGKDDRLDEYEVTNTNFRTAGDATVVLVYWDDLTNNGNGTFTLPPETFAWWYEWLDPIETGNALCWDEPYRDQPSPGFCSGVLVTPDLVATAGHCVSCEVASDLAVVFGFVMENALYARMTVSADQVYRCSQVVAQQDGYPDWSLVRLERSVADHAPQRLRRMDQAHVGQNLLVIGHPWGTPRKYDGGGTLRENSSEAFFQANLDTYVGSSGSAVFHWDTLLVEGLVSAGKEGFVEDIQAGCDRSRVCPDTGCPDWEDITRATAFSAVIPSFDVYLGTDSGGLDLVSGFGVVPWHSPPTLQTGRTYYWRIVARNAWGQVQGPLWSFSTSSTVSASPVYRFWSPKHGHHFYTIREAEKDSIIANYPTTVWTYEGPGFYAYPEGAQPAGTGAVYRFWSPKNAGHFYTMKESEKDKLIDNYPLEIWTYEGVGFYAYPAGSQPAGTKAVYRFWSPKHAGHFYTMKESEKDKLINDYPLEIWTYEGVAWYAFE